MGSLDLTVQQEMLRLLAPLLEREEQRRALVRQALENGTALPGQIKWAGAVEPFILRLTDALVGTGPTGGQALWQLLEFVRERLPKEDEARIDELEPIINRPPAPVYAASQLLYLRVFLASPGDVADERALALQVIDRLNSDPSFRGRVFIESVAWDKPGARVPMLATMTPQAAIAVGLPKPSECDIVVIILWSRIGTPLPPDQSSKPDGKAFLSGTEWEYLDALDGKNRAGRPEILVYRRTEKCMLDSDDPQFHEKAHQRERVKTFFAGFVNSDGSIRQGYNSYGTPNDFRENFDRHLRYLVVELQKVREQGLAPIAVRPAPSAAPPLWHGSPFPGLRAFTPDDAPIFCGRGRETDELVRAIADSTRCVVVAGASGSGKSSLIAAGVLPRLYDNAIEGSKDWLLPRLSPAVDGGRKAWAGLCFTPGELNDNPFLPLSTKLALLVPEAGITAPKLAQRLETDRDALTGYVESALQNRPAWAQALIFIDQFEELFTVVAERYRAPFAAMLVTAAHSPRLRIVATLRTDYYHRFVELAGLTELLRGAAFPLAAPGLAALFEMIAPPAVRAGLSFEAGLPARILEDTGTDSGALAMLAFALHELYEARTPDGHLTHSAYDAFGGVQGAISRRAEETFKKLPSANRDLLGSVFRDLVEVDERGEAMRRRIARAQVTPSSAAAELVDAFTNARLLVTDRSTHGDAMVEVAHDALLRKWPRLVDWISERAEDFRLRRQAEAAAAEWQRAHSNPSYLWPHDRLAPMSEALSRLGLKREDLDEPVRSFLTPEADRLLAQLERSETSHDRRAEIGDRLDRIGDSRPGVGLINGVPDIVWCEIPGASVILDEVDGDFDTPPFSIAKYPITYRQYRAFLDDPDGYRGDRWWNCLKRFDQPGAQYRVTGNCPAENVNWYDAMAYCGWLSVRLGYDVRLPTEWEWQQAATGGNPSLEYPWGRSWADGLANTETSHLGRTTAIGMYPRGASTHGVMDLVGNIWEWCLNRYDDPRSPVIDLDENASRAVRGSSWNESPDRDESPNPDESPDRDKSPDGARCLSRDFFVQDARSYFIGFRIVRVTRTD